MSTLAQIEANRRNSQKSAASHAIRGEDPGELQSPTAEFLFHHRPPTPTSAPWSIPSSPPSGPNAGFAPSKPNSGITKSNASTTISAPPNTSTSPSNTIPASATPTRTPSRPSAAYSAASNALTACTSAPSLFSRISRKPPRPRLSPLRSKLSSPSPWPPNRSPPSKLNHLRRKLASFCQLTQRRWNRRVCLTSASLQAREIAREDP
jgi:hypothetical protein